MPTTSNFGWTTPADTDLVKDGAAAIRTLGNGIDTSLVDLKGGTTGQILSKASNTDLDFSWVAQDDSNAIQNAIVDAKGDLISATAADTPARLAVGANGTVLTADSAEATGLKWAALSSTPTIYGCSLDTTTDQTLANATSTYLNFGAETFDSGGYHDNSTNNSRITIPSGKGGYYLIFWSVYWDNGTTGNRRIAVEKNRTTGIDYIDDSFGNSGAQNQNNAVVANLTAGDYIEINARQTSGGNLNVKSDGASTTFGAILLGV